MSSILNTIFKDTKNLEKKKTVKPHFVTHGLKDKTLDIRPCVTSRLRSGLINLFLKDRPSL